MCISKLSRMNVMPSGEVAKMLKQSGDNPNKAVSSNLNDAKGRQVTENPNNKTAETKSQDNAMGGRSIKEESRPDTANKPVAPQNNPVKELQQFMSQLLRGDSTAKTNDTVGRMKSKNDEDQSQKGGANNQSSSSINRNDRKADNPYVSRQANRRKDEDEEDESGDNRRRRRRPAQLPNKQQAHTPSIIQGAIVGESQTQDMFVSSAVTQERITGKVNKSVIEQIKEYSETDTSDAIYNIVSANYNHKEKNGIGPNMQKDLFGEMLSHISKIDDVISPEFNRFVRDVVQGAMRAGYDSKLEMKDLVKMLISGFMAMSPHDDDYELMAEVIKSVVCEIMYGKINIGYNMKSASMWLGAASYTLVLYYKEYQNEIQFNRELEQNLNISFSENIWKATGEISNYSQVSAKANVEQFMAGRMEEEKIHSKNYVKDMVFSPLKKVFNK